MSAPLQILAVDDSPDDLFALRRILGRSRRKHVLRCASSAQEALDLFREAPANCVLLDYGLPDMTGSELADALHQECQDRGGAPPAMVMLTGQGSEAIAVDAMKRGVHDYLVKGSISEDTLDFAIGSALERAQTRRELARRQAALVASNRELERFSSMVAHDLQAPLSSMEMMLRLLQARAGTEPELRQYVENALAANEGMRALVVELLDYSRAGGGVSSFGAVDLAALEQNVRLALAAELSDPTQPSATLEWNAQLVVHGDRVQLSQLLTNLIGNSLKYRDPARPAHVTMTAEQGDSGTTITVTDNGRGISDEFLPNAFEPFARERTDVAGTGLGLAICRKIAEVHGGTLQASSRVDCGSQFQFTLPTTPRP